ncbi:hypothetical protein F6R98_13085 [Candidatus Methylospira mobilis]|uniref:Uncharacterized protein n=1 Tax=Candidatus Methylospira mobilis TaxID=1808979 RepID=A0A5Q0BMW0_9GAMM|nr:hypothetical protein [Candidatus Methylospira mobilis]QFY43437.1 hypothetical protein F6R98_13085 [Candidatus Methylospira mobilis]WNV03324.1 hypothetical protein RP726_12750 [Candidatus Methylospira mobilis]
MKRKLLMAALLASIGVVAVIGTAKADEDDHEYRRRGGYRAEREYYDDNRPRYNPYYPPVRGRPYYNPGYAYPQPGVNINIPLPLPVYLDPDRLFSGRR